jgi:KaiC/GvpD/RAD55 family RecA-like ATPase
MAKEIKELPQTDYVPPDLPHPIVSEIEAYLKSLGDGSRKFEGLETGLTAIDELIGGLNRFVLLAGMAGVGKSTLALQMGLGVIKKEKVPVIYYSFEMSKRDIITMAVQNLSKKTLFRTDLELRGNAPDQTPEKADNIKKSVGELTRLADLLYVVDSSKGTPDIEKMTQQIEMIKIDQKTEKILVIIDSLQDIVVPTVNQAQAEESTAQLLVELQQKTNATILAIGQKNKAGVGNGGGYQSVKGSVAFVHKPTTVIELIGGKEAMSKMTPEQANEAREALELKTRDPEIAHPVYMNVIKGRNSGYGGVSLKYYGAYRYYEVGQEDAFSELYEQAIAIGI